MIGVLFWNACITKLKINADMDEISERNDRIARTEDAIVEMTKENGCDIIVLAEYCTGTEMLLAKLSLADLDFSERTNSAGTRIRILASQSLKCDTVPYDLPELDTRYELPYFVFHNWTFFDRQFLLGCVHFPSKIYAGERDAEIIGGSLVKALNQAGDTINHRNIILTGDFNANPFEQVMCGFDYLHAIYDAETVQERQFRTVYYLKRQIFYNPMWNYLGDDHRPQGTCFSTAGKAEALYWNVFDQVIMSADCIPAFRRETLKILTGTASHSFLDKKGRPDRTLYSDHLPIVFSFREDLL